MKDRMVIITKFYAEKAKPDDQFGNNFESTYSGKEYKIKYRAHNETIYTITINTNLNQIRKHIGSTVVKFTNEELRFFDNLGFEIDPIWGVAARQSIDDWFLEVANENKN